MIIFVRNLVVNDFWLKLFSLVLAILIWLTVDFSVHKEISPWAALIGRSTDEAVLPVHVSIPGMEARTVRVAPTDVEVTLRGDPKLLQNISTNDVHAQVNLTDVESASGLRRAVEIVLPQGVSYTQVKPAEVEISVSPK
jgi:YbbR domain-containing protein